MPKCVPCLGQDVKDAILKQVHDHVTRDLVGRLATCPRPAELQVCGKGTRPRSAYQEWASQCLKAKHLTHFDPEAMRDCAAQWRAQKGLQP